MSVPYYEYIVVGCGGIGSGAVFWLSKRAGKGVLGLEQFKLGHDNGGSQDVSRIIRLSYDDQTYNKLAAGSYKAWEQVERESGLQLVHKCGMLNLVERDSPHAGVLDKYVQAMDLNQIPYERLDGVGLRKRYPQFNVGPGMLAVYQKDGGLVDAALGNAAHIQLARGYGATIIDNCPVTKIEATADGFSIVHTTKGPFKCRRLVVTAGAWINHVLGSVGIHIPVTVTQEQVTYLASPHMKDFVKDKFPAYIYHGKHEIYGLPIHCNTGTKLGIDAGGPPVQPSTRSFTPDPVRERICVDFLKKYIPKAVGPILYSKTCLYTMPPDRDFVIDTLAQKGMPQIIICCGAGHAFKFASVLGQLLSEMAIDGRTQFNTEEFKLNRPALNDPNFKPQFLRGRDNMKANL